MYQIMRIFIISALMSIYQIAKSEAALSRHQAVSSNRNFVSQSFDSEVFTHETSLTRDDSHPYPSEKRDSGSTAPISNKYRSDKKEYRFCFMDRMHHQCCIQDPAHVLPAPASIPAVETLFPIGGESVTLPATERRE
jgi:hypothetical protein